MISTGSGEAGERPAEHPCQEDGTRREHGEEASEVIEYKVPAALRVPWVTG